MDFIAIVFGCCAVLAWTGYEITSWIVQLVREALGG